MIFHDSKSLPHTSEQMFDLVADIESYPEFLPGWSRARILESDSSGLEVEQEIGVGPLSLRFQSTAQLEDCNRILITSRNKAFGELSIDWHFTPLPDNHCEVSLDIKLLPSTGLVQATMSRLLAPDSKKLLSLFENRAYCLYSSPG